MNKQNNSELKQTTEEELEDNAIIVQPDPLLEDTDEIKHNNDTLDTQVEVKETPIANAIEKGISLVSFGNTKEDNQLDTLLKLHKIASSIDDDEYLDEEESFLFFKTMQNMSFDHIEKDYLVKNGIIITTSIVKLIPIYNTIEKGTLVLTLPFFNMKGNSRIIHKPQTISKGTDFWISHTNIEKELKGAELHPFKMGV